MRDNSRLLTSIKDQRGVSAIVIAIVIVLLVMFTALAIDIGHLFVVRNELQNAADAGALAGARFLYNEDGTLVNVGANQIAYDAATANRSEGVAAEVNWPGGNGGDVQRGHWSFASRTFTSNDSTAPVDLWNVSTDELDQNPDFINAIRVVTRREAIPAASFFAKIFGHESFSLAAEAIAYIGFAGMLEPHKADQPIGICAQSITINDEYTCNIGRMLNSGAVQATHNTAGWTNFSQPCSTANASEMKQLVCTDGNSNSIKYGESIGTTGGVQQVTLDDLRDCWIGGANDLNNDGFREAPIDTDGDNIPDQRWTLTLPVIDCPGNNVSNCSPLRGIVTLQVIWVSEAGTPEWENTPKKMEDWPRLSDLSLPLSDLVDHGYSLVAGEYEAGTTVGQVFESDGKVRWASFVRRFNLKNADDLPAPYAKKSIYFLPDCTPHMPTGTTGGENFGILARIPVLVK
jgi:Flp pilus assembly protein TadG